LDRTLREDLLNELRMILHRTNIPAIYVTHDQDEAFAIADRVLILHNGEIIRAGTPADVWANPGSAFVARFLGLGNIFEGRYIGKSAVETKFGMLAIHCEHKHQKGENVHLLARPLAAERDSVSSAFVAPLTPLNANTISGVVTDVIFQQDRFKVTLDNGLYVYLPVAPKVGEKIEARVKVECLA